MYAKTVCELSKVYSGHCCAFPEWTVKFSTWCLQSSALATPLQELTVQEMILLAREQEKTVREESDFCQKTLASLFQVAKRILLTVSVGLSGEGTH